MTWGGLWGFLRDLTGERAYERYLDHRARRHPGEPVLAEKEFWRRRTDAHRPRTCC
ncbi:YbdD/YjiX family protein [Actinocorallia longicatena]|uniref:YbdD/YjiX family protein n=1 Tax=Actinocorallia longicatena TaxID=111803 RepID=A0ABP6QGM4_9ACTN